MKKSAKGYICAILSGAFFGTIPLFVLGVSGSGAATNAFCVMARMLLAGLMLLPFAIGRIRKQPPDKKNGGNLVVSACALAATSVLLYTAYQYIPSGIGITLHYTYPLVVMLISILLFHVRVDSKTVVAMMGSLIGIVLLCDVSRLSEDAPLGILLALLSSLTFSIYLIWNERRGLAKMDPIVFVTVLSLMNAALIAIYNLATDQLRLTLSPRIAFLLICTGALDIGAIFTQILAIKYVGSVYTSILGTLEPIICTIGSALVFHDIITGRMVFGGALVLTAVILVTLKGHAPKKKGGRVPGGGA